jgi:hypothetical protein
MSPAVLSFNVLFRRFVNIFKVEFKTSVYLSNRQYRHNRSNKPNTACMRNLTVVDLALSANLASSVLHSSYHDVKLAITACYSKPRKRPSYFSSSTN